MYIVYHILQLTVHRLQDGPGLAEGRCAGVQTAAQLIQDSSYLSGDRLYPVQGSRKPAAECGQIIQRLARLRQQVFLYVAPVSQQCLSVLGCYLLQFLPCFGRSRRSMFYGGIAAAQGSCQFLQRCILSLKALDLLTDLLSQL